MQANHTALDSFPLSPDEEDTEITVPNKEGTRNTARLCIILLQLLAHFLAVFQSLHGRSMYASSRSCLIAELTRLVYRQVRSSKSVTFAGHKTRTAEETARSPSTVTARLVLGTRGRCRERSWEKEKCFRNKTSDIANGNPGTRVIHNFAQTRPPC